MESAHTKSTKLLPPFYGPFHEYVPTCARAQRSEKWHVDFMMSQGEVKGGERDLAKYAFAYENMRQGEKSEKRAPNFVFYSMTFLCKPSKRYRKKH